MKKSREEILSDLEYRLKEKTSVTNTDPGSVARTFLEVLTDEFYEFYDSLDLSATMGFVSTAGGRFLDMIGTILDCRRILGEEDDVYRARITNQVYIVAGANITSIRLRALSVAGVSDVIFRQYSHGAGSFTCYVITQDAEASRNVLNGVRAAIEDTKAFGVYAEVTTPVLIPVELMVRLVFSNDAGNAEKETIRQSVARNIQGYVNGLRLGESLIVNETIQRIMDTNTKIQDVDIYSMTVNGTSRYITNASIRRDEKFILEALDIT